MDGTFAEILSVIARPAGLPLRKTRSAAVFGAVVFALVVIDCQAAGPLKVLWQTSHFTKGDHNFVVRRGSPPLAFSGDSKLLAVGRGHDVVMHDVASGDVLATTNSDKLGLKWNEDSVEMRCPGCISLSPDGTILATTVPSGRDVDGKTISEIFLWEASSGRFLASLPGHQGTDIDGLVFSAPSDDPTLRLVSLGRDGYSRLWNVTRREEVFAFEAPRTQFSGGSPKYRNSESAWFTRDGEYLITAARYEIARRTAKEAVVLSRFCISENCGVATNPLVMSSDGKYAQLFGDLNGVGSDPDPRSILSVVNLATCETRVTRMGRRVTIAEFGRISSRIYSLIDDSVECRNVTDMSVVHSTKVSTGEARLLAMSASESALAVLEQHGSIRCFAIEDTGLKFLGSTPEETEFLWILFSPDGRYLVGSSPRTGRVVVYEVPRP